MNEHNEKSICWNRETVVERCSTKMGVSQIYVLQCNCFEAVVKILEKDHWRKSHYCSYSTCNFTKLYSCAGNFRRFWPKWLLPKIQKKLKLPITFNEAVTFTFSCSSLYMFLTITAQKMKFSIEDLFSKCEQIRTKLRI